MMNGRMRSMLIRNQTANAVISDTNPKSIQFDESSDDNRCFCNYFHIKTGSFIVGGIEIFMLIFFFINSMTIMFTQDRNYQKAAGIYDNYMSGAFLASMIGITISIFNILLLFIGLFQNCATLLIPHLFTQFIAILALFLCVCNGIIAFATDSTLFYKLLHAVSFNEPPDKSTVSLDLETAIKIYVIFVIYALCLALEIWFIIIVYNCYNYLTERKAYMQYCLAFSTPMKTLSKR